MPTGMGERYELVAGELRVMSPSGWRHGKIVSRLTARLASYVEEHDLGLVFGAETGFRLATNPDTVRAPDASFVAKKNLPESEPGEGFWPGAPDLAVEVLSPGDRAAEVKEKVDAWLTSGCGVVWIVDPKLQSVTVHRSNAGAQTKLLGDSLSGEAEIPGFLCTVDELFH